MNVRRYHADHALLPQGWTRDVLIEVNADGLLAALSPGCDANNAERLAGPVIPGMPNLHSHAFQRAMAGLTEKGGPAGDSFWSWREQMYRFLERLTPDDVQVIATRLYVEMLEAGYTSVAEFHYLHHDADGTPYADPAEMAWRHLAAADAAGIGLTLLPVLYAHSNFGGLPPTPGQRRFIHDGDAFDQLLETLAPSLNAPLRRLGVAPHSLRAVTPEALHRAVATLTRLDATGPIHIHAAEQQKEIDDSLAWSGQRPVEWLVEHAHLDPRWTLIHATHMTPQETVALARSGATAGLCPSTEGDLGDGFFDAPRFLEAEGHFGIGGDSHVGVDPFQELRLFEYGQRLRAERRNVLVREIGASLGGALYRRAAAGGGQALGQSAGTLAVGQRADWVVLNIDDAALAEQHGDGWLDAAIFGPARRPVRDVMVGGVWQVRDGVHPLATDSLRNYRRVLRRLLA
jgi:formimidoylglutamate deiminase